MMIAALLHIIDWRILEPEFHLSPGISIAKLQNSAVGDLYKRACEEFGMDDGEPYLYKSYVLVDSSYKDPSIYENGSPDGIIDRVCNVMAIVLGEPVGLCRVFTSSDCFATYEYTTEIFTYNPPTEWLIGDQRSALDDAVKRQLRDVWMVADSFCKRPHSSGRIMNALNYFYLSWRSHFMEQTCINLSICLEVLFAPHSQSETTHQISFNVSRFLGTSPEERERVYSLVKTFYRARSAIVHGGIPDFEKFGDVTIQMFRECSLILKRILSDSQVALLFEDESSRRAMLSKFVFE